MTDSSARKRKGSNQWLEALEWYTALCEAPESELAARKLYASQQWFAKSDNQRPVHKLGQLLAGCRDCRQPAGPSHAWL